MRPRGRPFFALLFCGVVIDCQAILLDLDGVLVDSTGAVARTWAAWAKKRGLPAEEVIAHAHGRRSIETIRIFAPELDAERENVNVERMEIEDREGVRALAGAEGLLGSLPQERYAIVTSATTALARARLGYAVLPVPRNLVSADDVIEGKPSPEPYLKGAGILGFAPEDCVVIEDAPAGILAGQRAGMGVIALTTTYALEELKAASVIIPALTELHVETVSAAGLRLITA